MRSAAVAVSILVFACIGITNAAISDEIEAKKFVDQVSGKLYDLYDRISENAFNVSEVDIEALFSNLETIRLTSKALADVVENARKFDYENFKNPNLKEVFKTVIKSADLLILGDEYFTSVVSSLISLEGLASDKDIEPYQKDGDPISYFPDVQNIIAKSNNPIELKYYWESWRDKNSHWATMHFSNLILSYKKAANLTGITPLEMWSEFYDIEEMANVMKQIRPLYVQLHSYIRKQLYNKYGEQVIRKNGPIPDHLFQQVLAQTWTDGSVIDDLYPHKNLPPYDKILVENNYNANKMFRTASNFYYSLGFNPVPEQYWSEHLKLKEEEDTGDCKAEIYDMTSSVRMEYCHKVDFRKFLQAHGYMGQIYYALEKKNLPFYYLESYNLQYPVGEAVILSASTPKHLKAVGLVTNFQFTDEILMNRLLRMGIHTLLNLPTYFVHTKLMNDLFAGTVDIEGLNKHYWKLMEEYAGVEPPSDRPENFFDFPFKFYTDLEENTHARKFTSEILGYQFYRKLCQISGHSKGTPLHNCDFYESTSAGDALKNMMELGSSKPWREVLEKILPGNAKLNGDGLLKYYQPIKVWLEDQNRRSRAKLGWNPSRRKIG